MALIELSLEELVKAGWGGGGGGEGGQKYTPSLSKTRVSSKLDICIDICQMLRATDRTVLQKFVEKKRFLEKITKQGILIRLEVQQKIQILTSRGWHYFTLLKNTIYTPKLRILF